MLGNTDDGIIGKINDGQQQLASGLAHQLPAAALPMPGNQSPTCATATRLTGPVVNSLTDLPRPV